MCRAVIIITEGSGLEGFALALSQQQTSPRTSANEPCPGRREHWSVQPQWRCSWAHIRNKKFLSLLEAQTNPAGLYFYSKQPWIMFPMIPDFHRPKHKVVEISQEYSLVAAHHQNSPWGNASFISYPAFSLSEFKGKRSATGCMAHYLFPQAQKYFLY